MSDVIQVTRRDFLRYAGVGAGALMFGCHVSPMGSLTVIKQVVSQGFPLNNFVTMHLDGTIIITAHRSEMGQGIRSSLAAVLADELEADWSRVRVHQADADGPRYAIGNANPSGSPKWLISDEVSQFADSSRSMALFYMPMRLFGAGIRLVMERAAAKHFGVDVSKCKAKQHKVWYGTKHVDYHQLLLLAATVGVPQLPEIQAVLKKKEEWNFIGKEKGVPFVDAHDMVTGKAVYAADVDPDRSGLLSNLLTAMVVRCPVANGKVKSFDATEARKVPGVVDVMEVLPKDFPVVGGVGGGFLPHAGVAVIAENTWAALKGRRALKVEWDLEGNPHADYDSEAYRAELKKSTALPGAVLRHKGDVDAAFVGTQIVEEEYYVPHLAQAPMEPPAAVALYTEEKGGSWEIWSSTQGPELTQHWVGLAMLWPNDPLKWLVWQVADPTEVAKECEQQVQVEFSDALGKKLNRTRAQLFEDREALKREVRERVKVHVTLLGGGFGRKSKPDYAIEAAFLAKHHPGVPIRVQWTREDDLQFSFFHAVSNQRLKAGLNAEGRPTAWLHRSAFPSFFATLFPPHHPDPALADLYAKARAAYHGGGKAPLSSSIERAQGLEDMPFDIENLRIENCEAENHIRVGWMRSVSNIFHAFAIGSFADEMAIAAGRDSKDYLLDLIGKGRLLDLEKEGVECFDNNGFASIKWEGKPAVVPPYPPDTRRLRSVIERVARESGWDEKVKQYKGMKRGLGIAAHRSFLSYVAIVVDVTLNEDNELTINEIYGAIDCGIAVNPDRMRAQMEGGIIYGLSYALHGEITVKKGEVQQHNFDDYPVLRLYQTPKKINSYFEPPSAEVRTDWLKETNDDVPPTGVGEPPTPAVAPALANAIVAAGGPRIRSLPMWQSWEKDQENKVRVL
jgi:isoquinoline 1-oxidoreductase beta subunit